MDEEKEIMEYKPQKFKIAFYEIAPISDKDVINVEELKKLIQDQEQLAYRNSS